MIKTPAFWYKGQTPLSALLLPASWVYQIGMHLHEKLAPPAYRSRLPVLCIGNAVAGGGGKTPTAIAMMTLIKQNQIAQNPVFLTRGYGRKRTGSLYIEHANQSFFDTGDEAQLLAKHAPVVIAANRAEGARLAEHHGADLIVMDDGLFHHSLKKDLNFIVIDRAMDFGNGRTLPAGPLRAPLSHVLPRIDAVITLGRPLQFDKPVFEAEVTANLPESVQAGIKIIGFAGIGVPDKFKKTLENMKLDIQGFYSFPDHYPYNAKDIQRLKDSALEKQALLVTTEKDYVRLDPALQDGITPIPVECRFHDKDQLIGFLKNFIKEHAEKNPL